MKAAALAGKAGYTYYALGGALGNVGYDAVRAAAGVDVSAQDVAASALFGAGLGLVGYRFGGAAAEVQAAQYKAAAKALADARAADAASTRCRAPACAYSCIDRHGHGAARIQSAIRQRS